jgi:hypothetical protein
MYDDCRTVNKVGRTSQSKCGSSRLWMERGDDLPVAADKAVPILGPPRSSMIPTLDIDGRGHLGVLPFDVVRGDVAVQAP